MKNKKIKIALLCVLSVIALIAVGLFVFETAVKKNAEEWIEITAPKIIGNKVHMSNISYNLWKHRLTISDLWILNPEGYSNDQAISVEKIQLKITPAEALKLISKSEKSLNLFHIKDLHIDGILFSIEPKDLSPFSSYEKFLEAIEGKEMDLNFMQLKQKCNDYQKEVNDNHKNETKLRFTKIENLNITNTTAKFRLIDQLVIPEEWQKGIKVDNFKQPRQPGRSDTEAIKIFELICEQIKKKTIIPARKEIIINLRKKINEIRVNIQELKGDKALHEAKIKDLDTEIVKAQNKLTECETKLEELKKKNEEN